MPKTTEVVWSPQPGSQVFFLSCPIFETLYEGTRGPGKTDALLMDFAQHVGRGFGRAWRGILFREEATQLEDVRNKALKWFPRIFPTARYIGQPKDKWVFADGEELLFRHMRKRKDYQKYHGHEYPWIGWEELTNWPDAVCYHLMKSCCRSTDPRVPLKYRATANPHGRGHNWVKAYFVDPAEAGRPFVPKLPDDISELLADAGVEGVQKQAVRLSGHYTENRALMDAQPDYAQNIAAAAETPEQAKAWLNGDWDIVAGGMFDDVWSRKRQVIPPFTVPSSWRVNRSYDWGSSKPFSVGWWAESDGTDAPNGRAYPPGTLFRVGEWYGWNGNPNQGLRLTDVEIADGIVEREVEMGLRDRVRPGPADTSIWVSDPGKESAADIMARRGVRFTKADKSPGSRKQGWRKMRQMLKASYEGDRELPGLYVFDTCPQFVRTVPTLPRDEKDPDDVDTTTEDHVGDESRYRVLDIRAEPTSEHFVW